MPSKILKPISSWVKQPEVIKSLTLLAKELGVGARLPSVRELSKMLGVTVVTLNHCLRKLEQQGVIIRQSRKGIFVAPQIRGKAIALVSGMDFFTTGEAAFYRLLLERCVEHASAHQQKFSFFLDDEPRDETSPAHRDLVHFLHEKNCSGILHIASPSKNYEDWLRSFGIPVVALNFGFSPYSVAVGFNAFIPKIVQELIRLKCRNIALLGSVAWHTDSFREACTLHGITYREEWVHCKRVGTYKTSESYGSALAEVLLSLKSEGLPFPEAVIIADDNIARGACIAFEAAGCVIGKDLILASHCNKGSGTLREWNDFLLRCEIDPRDVSEAMFRMLEPLMTGTPVENDRVVISPTLIRGSNCHALSS